MPPDWRLFHVRRSTGKRLFFEVPLSRLWEKNQFIHRLLTIDFDNPGVASFWPVMPLHGQATSHHHHSPEPPPPPTPTILFQGTTSAWSGDAGHGDQCANLEKDMVLP
jgi:hypothetical protein